MEEEPETLEIWHRIVKNIERVVHDRRHAPSALSDVNITEIFCGRRGGRLDEHAVIFWSQLISMRRVKAKFENELGAKLKRGGKKMVHQIPLCPSTVLSDMFKESVENSIINTPFLLWTLERPVFKGAKKIVDEEQSEMEPNMKVIEEDTVVIDGPETLAEAIIDGEAKTPSQSESQKRKYSQREMRTPVDNLSQSQQRRVKKKLKDVVVEAMKCPPEEVSALAKLLLSPQERQLLRNSSDLTDACESISQTPSILVSDSVEKLMKRHVTFTDDEKMDVVEALADYTDKTKLKQGLLDLHNLMGDRKFTQMESTQTFYGRMYSCSHGVHDYW